MPIILRALLVALTNELDMLALMERPNVKDMDNLTMNLINTEDSLFNFNVCMAMAFFVDTFFLYIYVFDELDFFNFVGAFIASAMLHAFVLPIWGLSAFILFLVLKLSQCLIGEKYNR